MVDADALKVERALSSGGLGCPVCAGVLRRSGWARRRTVRGADAVGLPLRPRRARCVGCDRTHVLLPVFVLVRRPDVVAVIGAALVLAAAAAGFRTVAALGGAGMHCVCSLKDGHRVILLARVDQQVGAWHGSPLAGEEEGRLDRVVLGDHIVDCLGIDENLRRRQWSRVEAEARCRECLLDRTSDEITARVDVRGGQVDVPEVLVAGIVLDHVTVHRDAM